jgi:hypothetical protein
MDLAGASWRRRRMFGMNPARLRVQLDGRAEAAAPVGSGHDDPFGRAALDVTVSRPIVGIVVASITAAGGTSAGPVPIQRHWFLGGIETVRGERPDTAIHGNAFWLTRSELGAEYGWARPSIFVDVGHAGERAAIFRPSRAGRPLTGVGVGVSFGDGLFRLDVARGVFPKRETRLDASFDARF